jgi:hypothetical protein
MKEMEVYIISNNGYSVFIRNKNTSREISRFIVGAQAVAEKARLRNLPRSYFIQEYADAKGRNTTVIKHSYKFGKYPIDIREVDHTNQYGLYIQVNQREVLVMKHQDRDRIDSYLETLLLEYTFDELVEKTKEFVTKKLQERVI